MLVLQRRLSSFPGVSPSYDELRKDMGLKSRSGIAKIVKNLEEKGWIAKKGRSSRSLVILHEIEPQQEDQEPILSSFSDTELLLECQKRGLLILRHASVESQEL
jgi:SOS-response transcriptional repressor LexA